VSRARERERTQDLSLFGKRETGAGHASFLGCFFFCAVCVFSFLFYPSWWYKQGAHTRVLKDKNNQEGSVLCLFLFVCLRDSFLVFSSRPSCFSFFSFFFCVSSCMAFSYPGGGNEVLCLLCVLLFFFCSCVCVFICSCVEKHTATNEPHIYKNKRWRGTHMKTGS